MCLAILNKKKEIPYKYFENAWEQNSDGYGQASIQGGKLVLEKDNLSSVTAYNLYQKARKATHLPMMLHFRFATHGLKTLDNIHPFSINENLAFCHNGILDIETKDERSDTRIFNELLLKKLPKSFLENSAITFLIEEYLGFGNKLIFLSSHGKYKILNEKEGHWKKGTWYSNHGYQTSQYGNADFSYSRAYGVTCSISDAEQESKKYTPTTARYLTKTISCDFCNESIEKLNYWMSYELCDDCFDKQGDHQYRDPYHEPF